MKRGLDHVGEPVAAVPAEFVPQRVFEGRKSKAEAGRRQALRDRPLAHQEHFVRDLTRC